MRTVIDVLTLASWELRGAIRGRWVLGGGLVYALASVAVAFAGLRSLRALGLAGTGAAVDGLVNLGVLLPPLVGLLVGAASVSGAREQGLLGLLAAQPVRRWVPAWGALIGLSGAVAMVVAVGFGAAVLLMSAVATSGDLLAAGVVLILTLAAGLAGVSLGVVISALASTRTQALALAAALWFVLALGVDLLLVGVAPGLRLGPMGLLAVALLNPFEAARLLALLGLDPSGTTLGPFGAYLLYRFGRGGSILLLGGSLTAWVVAPTLVAGAILSRRDV